MHIKITEPLLLYIYIYIYIYISNKLNAQEDHLAAVVIIIIYNIMNPKTVNAHQDH